jgi:hypothetical protein
VKWPLWKSCLRSSVRKLTMIGHWLVKHFTFRGASEAGLVHACRTTTSELIARLQTHATASWPRRRRPQKLSHRPQLLRDAKVTLCSDFILKGDDAGAADIAQQILTASPEGRSCDQVLLSTVRLSKNLLISAARLECDTQHPGQSANAAVGETANALSPMAARKS